MELLLLTVPHHKGHKLERLLDVIGTGFRRVIGGRAWMRDRDRLGVLGYVKSTEVTHGLNGWHPHLHVLLFTSRPLEESERDLLSASMYGRWARYAEGVGLGLPKRDLCQLQPVRDGVAVAGYVSKVASVVDEAGTVRNLGLEMTRHDLKTGRDGESRHESQRTPFQILADFANIGDVEDLALWTTYAEKMKGKRLISWSRGLKGLLGVDEKADEDLVAEEEGAAVAVRISPADWRRVVATNAGVYRVLEIVEKLGAGRSLTLYLRVLEMKEPRGGPG